jgi:hypothetical protein
LIYVDHFQFSFLFMAASYAFVTLVSSDAYLPGALVLAAALKDIHPLPPVPPEVDFQTVCLVTPEIVDVSTIKHLRRAFNLVIGVEVIDQDDEKGLKLLGQFLVSLIVRLERARSLSGLNTARRSSTSPQDTLNASSWCSI